MGARGDRYLARRTREELQDREADALVKERELAGDVFTRLLELATHPMVS